MIIDFSKKTAYDIYMAYHSFHHRLIRQKRFRHILFGSMLFSVIIAFLIVPIERSHPNATIKSFSDGLWWVVQTVTTVGYGDTTPVTELGRLIGIVMQILGTVMFGTIIAMISSSMGRSQEEMYWTRLFDRLDTIMGRVEKVEKETVYLVKSEVETDQGNINPKKSKTK